MLAPRTSTTTATMGPPLSMAEPHVCAPIDANGNLTSDGSREFDYDAKNRTTAVVIGSARHEQGFDGQDRIVSSTKRIGGTVVSQTALVGCATGTPVCEERDVLASTTRHILRHGEKTPSAELFFTKDHLGSLRDVIDTGTVAQRSAYDPWGRMQIVGGTETSGVGFAGYRTSAFASLVTQYRLFDPDLGRWLSEDPIDLRDGASRYAYVNNRPQALVDPVGLVALNFQLSFHFTGSIEAVCSASHVAGGCWTNQTWSPSCECTDESPSCAPSSQFRAHAQATVGGNIYIYSGPFSIRNQQRNLRPKDRSVVDQNTAIYHELTHVNIATSAGLGPLAAVEARTFSSKAECQGECNRARVQSIQRFWAALRTTVGW